MGSCRGHARAEKAHSFSPIYVPEEYYPSRFETRQTLRRIDHALRQMQENRNLVELALTADDVERIRAKGKMAAVLDIEGSYDLDGDLGILRDLYRHGSARRRSFRPTTGTRIMRTRAALRQSRTDSQPMAAT